jgi:hypothetical protein
LIHVKHIAEAAGKIIAPAVSNTMTAKFFPFKMHLTLEILLSARLWARWPFHRSDCAASTLAPGVLYNVMLNA